METEAQSAAGHDGITARHAPVISALATQHSRTKRLRRDPIIPSSPPHCKCIVHLNANASSDLRAWLRRICLAYRVDVISGVECQPCTRYRCFVFPAKAHGRGDEHVRELRAGGNGRSAATEAARRSGSAGLGFAYPFASFHPHLVIVISQPRPPRRRLRRFVFRA